MEGFVDNNVLSGQIAQLKGMVATLLGQTKSISAAVGVAALPTVDFCCDMFDRADSSVLSGYWSDTAGNWTLRSGNVISQVPASAALTPLIVVNSSASAGFPTGLFSGYTYTTAGAVAAGVGNNVVGYPGITIPATPAAQAFFFNLYSAVMSSTDIDIKIGFYLAAAPAPTSSTVSTNTIFDTPPNYADTTETTTTFSATGTLAQSVGGVFSNTNNRVLGLTSVVASMPVVSTPTVSCSTTLSYPFSAGGPGTATVSSSAPGVTTPGTPFFSATFSDNTATLINTPANTTNGSFNAAGLTQTAQTTNAGNESEIQASAYNTVTAPTDAATTPPLRVGLNTFTASAIGNTYTFSINGVAFYTITSALMTNRSRAGFCNQACNALAAIVNNNLAFTGLTYFKAWRSDQPEPPSQSGHGTYVGGKYTYSDKYHAYNKAGTSFIYNPNA